MTVSVWCAQEGISTKTYYYRLKRVCEAIPEAGKLGTPMQPCCEAEPLFAEVTPAGGRMVREAAVTLRLYGMQVQIHNGAQRETIEAALQALRGIC